jgi:hypothetical protein
MLNFNNEIILQRISTIFERILGKNRNNRTISRNPVCVISGIERTKQNRELEKAAGMEEH